MSIFVHKYEVRSGAKPGRQIYEISKLGSLTDLVYPKCINSYLE